MLPHHIELEVVTPERLVLRENVAEAQIPGLVGFLGVLPGHTPLLAELGIGALSYRQGSHTYYATAIGGLVEVLPDRIIVLADASERAEEIDVARARAAAERARMRLAPPANSSLDWERAARAAKRAETRLEVAAHAPGAASAAAQSEVTP